MKCAVYLGETVHVCLFSPHHRGARREPRIEPPRPVPSAGAVVSSAGLDPAVSPVYTRAPNVQQSVCTKSRHISCTNAYSCSVATV